MQDKLRGGTERKTQVRKPIGLDKLRRLFSSRNKNLTVGEFDLAGMPHVSPVGRDARAMTLLFDVTFLKAGDM
jgi:hypothetical protein